MTATGTTPLSAGSADVVDIVATVPAAAASSYGASGLLQFVNPQLNGSPLAVTADRSVEKVAYFGDATGDGTLSGLDASLIARNAATLDDGFTAYPLTDPLIVGDVTGDGSLSGMDACYVAQKSVQLSVPQIPDVPAVGSLTHATVDPTIGIPTGTIGLQGGTVSVPVSITDNSSGVLSADFTITYDATRLSIGMPT